MKNFDKYIKELLERPPDVPASEEVWKKVQGTLHPGGGSWWTFFSNKLNWLTPLLLLPFAWWMYEPATNSSPQQSIQGNERTSVLVETDTIYRRVVVYEYDTIYRKTVVVHTVEKQVKQNSALSSGHYMPWQQGKLGNFLMRSDFLALNASPWSALRKPESFVSNLFCPSLLPESGYKSTDATEEEKKAGLYLNSLSANGFAEVNSASALSPALSLKYPDIEAAQKQALKSSKAWRWSQLAYTMGNAMLPDAFDFGITTSAHLFTEGVLKGHLGHSNGLNVSLSLNPRLKIRGGFEMFSVNYNETRPDRFARYPEPPTPPDPTERLTRIEPYLTYYHLPLGFELRLFKEPKTFEPYLWGGMIWQQKSEKNHIEYYFVDAHTEKEYTQKRPLYTDDDEEDDEFSFEPLIHQFGFGVDWFHFPKKRNLHLRLEGVYSLYKDGTEPELNLRSGIGLRGTLMYRIPFSSRVK